MNFVKITWSQGYIIALLASLIFSPHIYHWEKLISNRVDLLSIPHILFLTLKSTLSFWCTYWINSVNTNSALAALTDNCWQYPLSGTSVIPRSSWSLLGFRIKGKFAMHCRRDSVAITLTGQSPQYFNTHTYYGWPSKASSLPWLFTISKKFITTWSLSYVLQAT